MVLYKVPKLLGIPFNPNLTNNDTSDANTAESTANNSQLLLVSLLSSFFIALY